jgi:ABC-type polysaccharide/polyol phosphate transport system ATPase subunit
MAARVSLRGVSLDLPVFDVSARSLKKRVLRLARGIEENAAGQVFVRALDGIDLDLTSGDRLGLVGHNGAGKSTLLRVLAGIYGQTSGQLTVTGKVVPLLDISLGMDEQSTGRQNIRLRGLLLGMGEAEIREKTDDIANFTELGDYLDLPLRTYSSGMRLRLAFAIATAVDADVLLLDEVIGVGDASFQEKANRRLAELHARAEIVVLAIHDNHRLRQSCNKALWLAQGRAVAFGEVNEVLSRYEASARSDRPN